MIIYVYIPLMFDDHVQLAQVLKGLNSSNSQWRVNESFWLQPTSEEDGMEADDSCPVGPPKMPRST